MHCRNYYFACKYKMPSYIAQNRRIILALGTLFIFCSLLFVSGVHRKNKLEQRGLKVMEKDGIPKLTAHVKEIDMDIPLIKNELPSPRPHAKFTLQPWSINVSNPRSALFEDRNLVDRWASVTFIKSSLDHAARREAIRETWGSIKFMDGVRLETIFVLGRTEDEKTRRNLEKENEKYGDILQSDIPDNSKNVPFKILAGMWWASNKLPQDWLYSSADDDMVLHPPNFARFVEKTALEKGRPEKFGPIQYEKFHGYIKNSPIMCVYGFQKRDIPARDKSSKWYMPEATYPLPFWPPYCRGGWYSMPVETASKLYAVSRSLQAIYLDDVWITGLLRLKLYSLEKADDFRAGEILKEVGLTAAPLADRTDKEFYYNKKEDDLDKIIVSHTWGDVGWFTHDVTLEIKTRWDHWKASVFERMRYYISLE